MWIFHEVQEVHINNTKPRNLQRSPGGGGGEEELGLAMPIWEVNRLPYLVCSNPICQLLEV